MLVDPSSRVMMNVAFAVIFFTLFGILIWLSWYFTFQNPTKSLRVDQSLGEDAAVVLDLDLFQNEELYFTGLSDDSDDSDDSQSMIGENVQNGSAVISI